MTQKDHTAVGAGNILFSVLLQEEKGRGLWCSPCTRHVFTGHLLCARPDAKALGTPGIRDRRGLCPQGARGQTGDGDRHRHTHDRRGITAMPSP